MTPNAAEGRTRSSHARAPRSKRGCLVCRRRKIKCDEVKPICGRCKIRSRQCAWPIDGNGAIHELQASQLSLPTAPDLDLSFPPPPPVDFTPIDNGPIDTYLDLSWLNDLVLPSTTPKFYVPPGFLPQKAPKTWQTITEDDLLPAGQKAAMMADTSFLQPYFPKIEDRVLMRHYLLHTAQLLMAYEHPKRQWNPLTEHLVEFCFSKLPGTSPACDALRTGMLSCAAIHIRHQTEPSNHAAALRILLGAKDKILSLLQQVIDAQTPNNLLESTDIEIIMSALLVCTIASGLAADESWHELLLSIIAFVESLGGPRKILELCPRDRMSPLRFCCEQLAIRDVFACFYIQRAPRILNGDFGWFLESQMWSRTDDEWESTERMFGLSRGMIVLLAKANAVIAKIHDLHLTLTSDGVGSVFSMKLPDRIRPAVESSTPPRDGLESVVMETKTLMKELEATSQSSGFSPLHPRTQYADHAYRYAILIRLWTHVFGIQGDDYRIQRAARAIIELATELVARYHRVVWLTWPVFIAGLNLTPGDPARDTVRYLLSESK